MITGSWYAAWLPTKTPEEIVTRLNGEIVRIANLPDMQPHPRPGRGAGREHAGEFGAYQKADCALGEG
jgi:hypothetical protein